MCEHHGVSYGTSHSCCTAGVGPMRGLIKAWLLLLLSRGPAHGYQLMENLRREDALALVDPGLLYRTLRQFEGDGDVSSTWSTEGLGPARRVYEITEQGRRHLDGCALHVRESRARLGRFLDAWERLTCERKETE